MILTAVLLVALALIDGACSGFRSSLGRTGLVRHRPLDRRSAASGMAAAAVLLVPAAAIAGIGMGSAAVSSADLDAAGRSTLHVLLPYAVIVAGALLAYRALGWRQKYIAIALILGPFTLLRPLFVIAALVAGALASSSWIPPLVITLGAAAVLAVEPLLGLRWRSFDPADHHSPGE